MTMLRRCLLHVFLISALFLFSVSWSHAFGDGQPGTLSFEITMNETPIGQTTVSKRLVEGGLEVTVETKTEVNVLFVTFTYDHKRKEVWRDGVLLSVDAQTDDDGEQKSLRMVRNDGVEPFSVIANDEDVRSEPSDVLPLALWTDLITSRKTLLRVVDGTPISVTIQKLGDDTVTIGDQDFSAVTYLMKGDRERALWYDRQGELLKATFTRSGYDIAFTRQEIAPN